MHNRQILEHNGLWPTKDLAYNLLYRSPIASYDSMGPLLPA